MLLFRSEEHVQAWLKQWRRSPGEVLSVEACWRLARAWYGPDRRELSWRRKTPEEAEALFAQLGLTSPFWRLRPG